MRGNISFSEAHIEQDIVHQIFDYYSQPSKASLIKLQKVRILFMNKRVISPKELLELVCNTLGFDIKECYTCLRQ